ncbi:hypothetical protein DSM44344_04439 [Mycobacterium marinum]|nr:hypothetical protein DSM44344_04439 [Mycobacterium marinum]
MQGEPGFGHEYRFQFGDGCGEGGFVGQQLAAHSGPLRSAAGVDEHGARLGRGVGWVDHAGGVLAGGQRA